MTGGINCLRKYVYTKIHCASLATKISMNNTPQSGLCRGPRMQPICKKIALESKLSCDFLANVHFLLYLCKKFAHCALACAYE